MKKLEIKLYKFDELSDEAKETAIENHREKYLDYKWWDTTFEDVNQIGEVIGIDIDNIYFSHMYCQGSGACFEGTYQYKKGALKAIKEHAPKDEALHQIAKDLQIAQRKYFYLLHATVKHSGHYHHENCTDITVVNPERDYYYQELCDTGIDEALKDFMRWVMKRLYAEYEYMTSEEAIIEAIQANEYEFTFDGTLLK